MNKNICAIVLGAAISVVSCRYEPVVDNDEQDDLNKVILIPNECISSIVLNYDNRTDNWDLNCLNLQGNPLYFNTLDKDNWTRYEIRRRNEAESD